MVGIVVVSHSAALAEGVTELVRGVGGAEVPFRATGGLATPERPLGTDAALIHRAIEEVWSPEGVLVLMDLGSALLSAELARDMLAPEQRGRVRLCAAPLVEGAVAAAVQARLGTPLERLEAEAMASLSPKTAQLGVPAESPSRPASPTSSAAASPSVVGDAVQLHLTLRNRLGLHVRPAARLVGAVSPFPQAVVHVLNRTAGRGPADARSINALQGLGARRGDALLVTASGAGALEALAAIARLAVDDFGDRGEAADEPAPRPRPGPTSEGFLEGVPVSPGLALGPIRHLRAPAAPALPTAPPGPPAAEREALEAALDGTRAQLRTARDAAAARGLADAAAILGAHLLYLDDPALLAPALSAIARGRGAAEAWRDAVAQVAAASRTVEDAYLRARAVDVEEVGRQVLLEVLGGATPAAPEPGVLVAPDLAAADVARLDPARVTGMCTSLGGPTSHAAIVARGLGIPGVAALGDGILELPEGTEVLLDGEAGRVWPRPAGTLREEAARRIEDERTARVTTISADAAPAVTRDGHRVELGANVGSVADARAALEAGAEGIGLFRTELLFLDRRAAPDEEEQHAAYAAVAEAMAGRPIVIRTLDAGGDKPLPYLDAPREANPYLGWRAIRICLAHPALFKTQLRAIVRVAARFPVRAMFPMIATLEEWRAARALMEEARAEVAARGEPTPARLEVGIMVEIPAAALRAPQLAAEVDFFSIGTNDLTQYTMAAERGNPRVAALCSPFQPAVVELVRRVVDAAHAHARWVGVCGEMAGDPAALPLLVGLGVDELSMSPPAIARARRQLRALDAGTARAAALRALSAESAEEVRARLAGTP